MIVPPMIMKDILTCNFSWCGYKKKRVISALSWSQAFTFSGVNTTCNGVDVAVVSLIKYVFLQCSCKLTSGVFPVSQVIHPGNLVSSSKITPDQKAIPSPRPKAPLSGVSSHPVAQPPPGQRVLLKPVSLPSGKQFYRFPDGKVVQLVPLNKMKAETPAQFVLRGESPCKLTGSVCLHLLRIITYPFAALMIKRTS